MCACSYKRERERGCKKKYADTQVPLTQVFTRISITTTKRERKRALIRVLRLLRGQRGFSKFFFFRLFEPKVATSLSTSQIYSNRAQESVSSTPQNSKQTRFSLSLSLSLSQIEPKAKKEEGTGWRRLLCSPSPPLPRSSAGVQNPSREAEEEEEEARRRRGRRLLHRMRRRGTRTSTRRRKRHPPRTNARINRVKVKCGGQTLLLLLLR